MLIKYLGHSCFWIEFGEKRLLIDPFIAGNPMASNINQNDLEVDYMLITHGHGDHIGDAIDIGQRTKAIAIANFEVQNWLVAQGIIVGSIPIFIPSLPVPLKLGFAAGPLLTALFISRYGGVGVIHSYINNGAVYFMKDLGICLFFAAVGFSSVSER